MAALRRSRRLAQVLLRIKIKLLFALGAAEVIRLPFVLGSSGCDSGFYVHAAHRIFHCCCAIHYDLSLSVCESWLDDRPNVDKEAGWSVDSVLLANGSDRDFLISETPIFLFL